MWFDRDRLRHSIFRIGGRLIAEHLFHARSQYRKHRKFFSVQPDALALERPLLGDALRIVASGEHSDGALVRLDGNVSKIGRLRAAYLEVRVGPSLGSQTHAHPCPRFTYDLVDCPHHLRANVNCTVVNRSRENSKD